MGGLETCLLCFCFRVVISARKDTRSESRREGDGRVVRCSVVVSALFTGHSTAIYWWAGLSSPTCPLCLPDSIRTPAQEEEEEEGSGRLQSKNSTAASLPNMRISLTVSLWWTSAILHLVNMTVKQSFPRLFISHGSAMTPMYPNLSVCLAHFRTELLYCSTGGRLIRPQLLFQFCCAEKNMFPEVKYNPPPCYHLTYKRCNKNCLSLNIYF